LSTLYPGNDFYYRKIEEWNITYRFYKTNGVRSENLFQRTTTRREWTVKKFNTHRLSISQALTDKALYNSQNL
jgi:hypothetical protein